MPIPPSTHPLSHMIPGRSSLANVFSPLLSVFLCLQCATKGEESEQPVSIKVFTLRLPRMGFWQTNEHFVLRRENHGGCLKEFGLLFALAQLLGFVLQVTTHGYSMAVITSNI